MRANIIIHSVTGNIYLIAKTFQEKLQEKGIDARLYRIEDSDLHLAASQSNEANEYYEDIISLPLASNEKLRKGDAILIGCPSLFALPTAETKAFLDQSLPLLYEKALAGKVFYGFTATRFGEEDGLSASTGLQLWANAMDMAILDYPPYVHDEGQDFVARPGISIDKVAEELSEALVKALS